jgi:hypothetical protein
MNKWLYKNIYWLYFFVANIRMVWYIFTGQRQKSIKIIREHMDW